MMAIQWWLFVSSEHPPQSGDEVCDFFTFFPHFYIIFPPYKLSLKYNTRLFLLLHVAAANQLSDPSLSLAIFLRDFHTCIHNLFNTQSVSSWEYLFPMVLLLFPISGHDQWSNILLFKYHQLESLFPQSFDLTRTFSLLILLYFYSTTLHCTLLFRIISIASTYKYYLLCIYNIYSSLSPFQLLVKPHSSLHFTYFLSLSYL